jgi:hypothetical protein
VHECGQFVDGDGGLETLSLTIESWATSPTQQVPKPLNVLIDRINVANQKDEEMERLRSLLRKAHEPSLPFAKKVVRGIKRRFQRRKKKKELKQAAKKEGSKQSPES